jgi:hypothetical protein
VNPGNGALRRESVDAERERDERDCGRQREPAPRRDRAEDARALVADRDPDLATRGTR